MTGKNPRGRPRAAQAGDPFAAALGLRLRSLREAAGLSVAELASRSGVGVAVVYDAEQGRRGLSVRRLHALARALGATLGDFDGLPGGGSGRV